jgi:hypothetical protein
MYTPDIIGIIKSRRMKWAEHIARMREMRNAYKTLSENQRGDGLEDIGEDGRKILKFIRKK